MASTQIRRMREHEIEATARMWQDSQRAAYPWFSEDQLHEDWAVIQTAAKDAGRDLSEVGLEGAIYFADPRFEMPKGGRKPPTDFEDCIEYAHWWKKFGADPDWKKARAESEKDGRILSQRPESVYMTPTAYSPVK